LIFEYIIAHSLGNINIPFQQFATRQRITKLREKLKFLRSVFAQQQDAKQDVKLEAAAISKPPAKGSSSAATPATPAIHNESNVRNNALLKLLKDYKRHKVQSDSVNSATSEAAKLLQEYNISKLFASQQLQQLQQQSTGSATASTASGSTTGSTATSAAAAEHTNTVQLLQALRNFSLAMKQQIPPRQFVDFEPYDDGTNITSTTASEDFVIDLVRTKPNSKAVAVDPSSSSSIVNNLGSMAISIVDAHSSDTVAHVNADLTNTLVYVYN